MKMRHYMAIDLGATSGRSIIATFDGEKISTTELTRFANPMVPLAGNLYWDIVALYNEILKALKTARKQGIEPVSIGIDTWGCDVAYFNADGTLASLPFCYRGAHTEGAMEALFERMEAKELYRRTGIQFMPFNTIFQLDALQRRKERCTAVADKILFIPDALNYMLTGRAVTEYTVASTGQIIDPATRTIDSSIVRLAGIAPECFGELVYPGTILGLMTEQVREHTGQHNTKVIAVASHDTASAVAAVPVSTNAAYLSCGTWSLMGIKSDSPIITERSFAENFTNEGGIDGTTRFLKNICGLWLFERCRAEFTDAPTDIEELIDSVSSVPKEFNTIIDPDDNSFANPRSMIKAIEEYAIRTNQAVPTTPAQFCHCIFHSLAHRYKEVFTLLEELSGQNLDYLYVIGGGSKNRVLMQLTADAIGKEVITGATESTALGNILMQMRALGEISAEDMERVIYASSRTTIYKPNRL